ncbi:MAG: hypothetical protein K1X51_15620 [Rhodospirillaceae bacterium]|nr:hypothetical protein [Rhodospirillaceae bacterium]
MARAVLAVFLLAVTICTGVLAAEPESTRPFSPKENQADMSRLRDFVYPPGYPDDFIVALENGKVPSEMTVAEFSRLHCGETSRIVLNPCMVRYITPMGPAYYVVTTGERRSFTDAVDATKYFNERMGSAFMELDVEVSALNSFIEDFCTDIEKGLSAREALSTRGDRPRLNHAIAAVNPESKFPFSNLFQWEKCNDCVGIIAVRQETPAQEPRCGNVRKQTVPRVAYFVVDRLTSRGFGTIDEGLKTFGDKVGLK